MTDKTSVRVKKSAFRHGFAVLTNVSGFSENDIINIGNVFHTKVIQSVNLNNGDEPTLSLNSVWMSLLGIEHDTHLVINKCYEWEYAKNVYVRPSSESDWEILELNADKIQNSLLNQISIIKQNQKMVIFCDQMHIQVDVVKIEPNLDFLMLNNATKILVEPKERKTQIPDLPSNQNSTDLSGQKLRVCKIPSNLTRNHKFCAFVQFNDEIHRFWQWNFYDQSILFSTRM